MNVLDKSKESQGHQSYFRYVDRDLLVNRPRFADQSPTALRGYRVFSPPQTPDLPGFLEFKSKAEPDKANFLSIWVVYALSDSKGACNSANVSSVSRASYSIITLSRLYRSGFNIAWETSLPPAAHPKVRGAPDWLLQRMETLRRMPSLSLEEVRTQLKASAAAPGKFDAKPTS